MKMALKLMEERQAKILVETGTARYGDREFGGDGGSTIIFGNWAARNDAHLHSVDHSSEAIDQAKSAAKSYVGSIFYSCSDTLKFLENFDDSIDFLYLDSHEYDPNDPLPSQEHHLKEIVMAYPSLHRESIVMFDDCDLPGGGQGKLAIEFLVDNDWKILYQGYQTILSQIDRD
jgi:predicted O-methyltransferase YrrM